MQEAVPPADVASAEQSARERLPLFRHLFTDVDGGRCAFEIFLFMLRQTFRGKLKFAIVRGAACAITIWKILAMGLRNCVVATLIVQTILVLLYFPRIVPYPITSPVETVFLSHTVKSSLCRLQQFCAPLCVVAAIGSGALDFLRHRFQNVCPSHLSTLVAVLGKLSLLLPCCPQLFPLNLQRQVNP